MNIRDTIVASRRLRLEKIGHNQGLDIPLRRQLPLVPFKNPPLLICEIKRRSPSRGAIAPELDPEEVAKAYSRAGVGSFSVLTEEDYFAGSLKDLMEVKAALPHASVLRKDFLLDETDIEVSYRAGADAVLLIASILDEETLIRLYRTATGLGMDALVEVHSEEDVRKMRSVHPSWVGINARNLETFQIDLLHPLQVRRWIDWDAKVVFESGVRTPYDAGFVKAQGFEGLLVGEAAVRNPEQVSALVEAFEGREQNARESFWIQVAGKLCEKKPLVKVCGITNPEDAYQALASGADILGFIFAPSPRKADPAILKKLRNVEALKVGVVLSSGEEMQKAVEWVEEGYLDALQVHGPENKDLVQRYTVPLYPVMNPKSPEEAESLFSSFAGPRFLVDGFREALQGGTGCRVPDEVLQVLKERGNPLWLAGGLRPESIRTVLETWNPELVDVASGLESAPGKKDPERIKRFFEEVESVRQSC